MVAMGLFLLAQRSKLQFRLARLFNSGQAQDGVIAPEEFHKVNPTGDAPTGVVEGESDDDAEAAVGGVGVCTGVEVFDELAEPELRWGNAGGEWWRAELAWGLGVGLGGDI
jgi:hypothetical protein